MVAPPSLSTDVYDAIKADKLVGTVQGKTAVVTGAARGGFPLLMELHQATREEGLY